MDPSTDCMNLDKPPDPNEFPTLEAGAGIGKRSSPRLALNAMFVEEGAIENLGVQGAEALVGIPKLDNGLVMSTVQHAGDVLNSGINQDNSLPISPEQEADPANIVDTDMDAEEEDYSSGEDEEYHEDDDIFGKGNVYDSNHLNMSNRITGPSDRNESADGQISNLGFNLDGANQLGSIPQTNSAENSCKIRPLSEEEKLTRNEKAQGAHITYTNPIPDAEGFTTMRNRRNGNTGKSTSRLQQGESSDKNKRTSVQEKLKNVGNKEHQSISSDSNIQRKMGELHQSFRTHQVARVGMKSMNQVYRKKMGSHPFNTRKPAGTNLKAGKKHSDIYLSNCFDLLDEDDSVLDLEASILKGDLFSLSHYYSAERGAGLTRKDCIIAGCNSGVGLCLWVISLQGWDWYKEVYIDILWWLNMGWGRGCVFDRVLLHKNLLENDLNANGDSLGLGLYWSYIGYKVTWGVIWTQEATYGGSSSLGSMLDAVCSLHIRSCHLGGWKVDFPCGRLEGMGWVSRRSKLAAFVGHLLDFCWEFDCYYIDCKGDQIILFYRAKGKGYEYVKGLLTCLSSCSIVFRGPRMARLDN
ncbi:hypothetical protein E3N88_19779 [Mikania micrantha]|uniref:Uncharacterized protein n=1 Tax=Mikania micrantha TaxID=192012 RepID=A0A5N6NR47_9ASTR|nr:hypothetical protein E3N88_19779 [Mikania micrantha]